ncbi:MAG: Ig-like domain-containing protein, partial [Proteobacteria bacterium]|nr:Ig-like domain-containing protein [Pseudomonadota bacterium]
IVSAVRGEVLEGMDLLANDPASAVITQVDSVSSQGGSITQNTDGITFDYTPPAGFYGIDTFRYMIAEADAESLNLLVTIHVRPADGVEEVSIAVDDLMTCTPEEGVCTAVLDVLANDVLLNSQTTFHSFDTVSEKGATISLENGLMVYSSHFPFEKDRFTYTLIDPTTNQLSLPATVEVAQVNFAVDDLMTCIPEEGVCTAVLDVLANDVLLNSQATIHSFDTVSEKGATISLENGLMVYSSHFPFEEDRFTYTLIAPTTNQLSLPATVKVIPVIFHEPFENAGVLSDYTAYEETGAVCGPDINSRWTVDAGSLVVTDSCGQWLPNGSVGSLLIRNTDVFGDGTYYIDIGGPGSDNDHLGLVFGFRDVNNNYRVFASQEHRKIYLTEMSEGILYAIATIDYLSVDNEVVKNLSITLDQNSYAINYNDEISLEGELTGEVSAEFAPGQIGIYGAWMDYGQFDNLLFQPTVTFEDLSGAYIFQAAGGDLANRYIWGGSGSIENGPGYFDTYNHLVGDGVPADTITWTLTAVPDEPETYTIQSHYHGLYMDGDDSEAFDYSSDDRYEDTIVSRPAQHDDSQKWIVRRLANGHVTIQEKTNSYFLSNDFYIQKTVADRSGNVEWIATPQPENSN